MSKKKGSAISSTDWRQRSSESRNQALWALRQNQFRPQYPPVDTINYDAAQTSDPAAA